ncbi:MAG: ABC transporter permease [Defluviitaleaceae bacterium]|nr:ABC transporter permease [Defluviitaleaceae bacterium]
MLTKRMILLFFRNRTQVLFSLLAVIIIIGLYVIFLSSVMEQSLRTSLNLPDDVSTGGIMSGLILGGMIAVTSVTSSLGALGRCVADKENAARDFYTSPLPRWKIIRGYITGATAVGLIMTMTALLISVVYLNIQNVRFSLETYALLAVTAVLCSLAANAIAFSLTISAKNLHAYSALSNVVGTLIGFLMGIYLPVGQLPEAVQHLIRLFPLSHGASMFRQLLADQQMIYLDAPPQYIEYLRVYFGVVFEYGSFTSNFWVSAAVLVITAIVFYALALLRIGKLWE